MDTTMRTILFWGPLLAVFIWWFWYKKAAYFFYCLTDGPRLNITGNGFRIRKNFSWKNKKAQFQPLQFLFRGRIIGRKKNALIRAFPDLDGYTRDDYDLVSRAPSKLNYDIEKKQFYLENLGASNKICWRPLKDSESELRIFEGNRLYLYRDIQVWFGPFSLEIELSQKEPYNSDASFNSGLFPAFCLYQLLGICLLLQSPTVASVPVITICLPAFLLAVTVYALFNNCCEIHPIQIIVMVALTIGYFAYVYNSSNPEAATHSARFFVYFLSSLLLIVPCWDQVESKVTFIVMVAIAQLLSLCMEQCSAPDIGSITQTSAFFLTLLTRRTANQKAVSSVS